MRTLYMQQKVFKITDHYPITDVTGEIVYRVDQDFKFFGNKVRVSRPDGREIFTVEREVFRFLPRQHVCFTDGREFILQSRFSFARMRIDILPERLDMQVRGDFLSLDYDILRFGKVIAHIRKAFFSLGDRYEIEVQDAADEDLAVACAIAVDHLLDMQKNN